MSDSFEDRMDDLEEALSEHFEELGCVFERAHEQLTLEVPAEHLLAVCETLRKHKDLGFEQLIDLCGVDYAAYGQSEWVTESASSTGFGRGVDRAPVDVAENDKRFAAVYQLLSVRKNLRLRVKSFAVGTPPVLDSVVDIWNSANWFEREAFDLFGILFSGHPDLRRILTDYGFVGHAFRKDFPLIGHVEMHYDAEKQRVVYDTVEIEPRVLVPRVIRDDHGDSAEQTASQEADNA